MTSLPPRQLTRLLGLGFGIAIAFGNTVGVGILRLPGVVAESLGSVEWVVAFWVLGGLYALMGAAAVAELATRLPQAGGFYVYAKRAFGNFGFVVGWSDWFNAVATLSFQAITTVAVLGSLWEPAARFPRLATSCVVAAFTGMHWLGVRVGGTLTCIITGTAGAMLVTLATACFFAEPAAVPHVALAGPNVASSPLFSMAMLLAVISAMRGVLVTFDGWYAPIRMAEESTDPTRTLPRALIGGTLLVAVLYLIINLAFLRILPFPVLANSAFPAVDAARVLMPRSGAEIVQVISFVTLLSIFNAGMMGAPRILLAVGRDGFFTRKATAVSASGTPRVALAATAITCTALILTGTFEQIVALSAVFFTLNFVATYAALFVLRRREPDPPRIHRAFGYPVSTAVVLIGSILFLLGTVMADVRSALVATALLVTGSVIARFLGRRSIEQSTGEIRDHLNTLQNRNIP